MFQFIRQKDENNFEYKCLGCVSVNDNVKSTSTKSYTNLRRHLKRVHPGLVPKFDRITQDAVKLQRIKKRPCEELVSASISSPTQKKQCVQPHVDEIFRSGQYTKVTKAVFEKKVR